MTDAFDPERLRLPADWKAQERKRAMAARFPGAIEVPISELDNTAAVNYGNRTAAEMDRFSSTRAFARVPGFEDGTSAGGHYLGKIGEMAFARWLNSAAGEQVAEADLSRKPGGDEGIDFTLGGYTIDVKTKQRHDKPCWFPDHQELLSALYVCCCLQGWKVYVIGWQTRTALQAKPLITAPYGNQARELYGSDLHPPKSLLHMLGVLQDCNRTAT